MGIAFSRSFVPWSLSSTTNSKSLPMIHLPDLIIATLQGYGPEVWVVDYRMEQEQVATRGDYWQTRVQRPPSHSSTRRKNMLRARSWRAVILRMRKVPHWPS